jgi:hypothetical protein
MRLGSRLPARMRPSRATQAKRRPLWRVEGGPRMGRPRTMVLPARERRQRPPPRSRHRRRRPPPPRLPGSRRHLALRRLPSSALPRSGPHLPPTASPPPGRSHRRPVSARPPRSRLRLLLAKPPPTSAPRPSTIARPWPTGGRLLQAISLRRLPTGNRGRRRLHRGTGSAVRPVGSGSSGSRRPRTRLLPLPRPPRIRRAREPLTSGRAARRSRPASSLRMVAGRRTPPGPPRAPASTGRPARHPRHRRPDRRKLHRLQPVTNPGRNRARRPRRRHRGRPMLRLLDPVSSSDRIRARMPRTALATRRRPGRLGPGPRVPAERM